MINFSEMQKYKIIPYPRKKLFQPSIAAPIRTLLSSFLFLLRP